MSSYSQLVHAAIAKAATVTHHSFCAQSCKEMVLSFCDIYNYVIDNSDTLHKAFKSFPGLDKCLRENLDDHVHFYVTSDSEELDRACGTLRTLATTVRRLWNKHDKRRH